MLHTYNFITIQNNILTFDKRVCIKWISLYKSVFIASYSRTALHGESRLNMVPREALCNISLLTNGSFPPQESILNSPSMHCMQKSDHWLLFGFTVTTTMHERVCTWDKSGCNRGGLQRTNEGECLLSHNIRLFKYHWRDGQCEFICTCWNQMIEIMIINMQNTMFYKIIHKRANEAHNIKPVKYHIALGICYPQAQLFAWLSGVRTKTNIPQETYFGRVQGILC